MPKDMIKIEFSLPERHADMELFAEDLELVLESVDHAVHGADHARVIAEFLRYFRQLPLGPGYRAGDKDEFAFQVGIWTIFRFPDPAVVDGFRHILSEVLRKQSTAYISWRYDDRGLTLACSDEYIDTEGLAPADMPPNSCLIATVEPKDKPKMH